MTMTPLDYAPEGKAILPVMANHMLCRMRYVPTNIPIQILWANPHRLAVNIFTKYLTPVSGVVQMYVAETPYELRTGTGAVPSLKGLRVNSPTEIRTTGDLWIMCGQAQTNTPAVYTAELLAIPHG